jgi:hypothetical protein
MDYSAAVIEGPCTVVSRLARLTHDCPFRCGWLDGAERPSGTDSFLMPLQLEMDEGV